MKATKEFFKKGGRFIQKGLLSEKNRKRDLAVTLFVVVFLGGLLFGNHLFSKEKELTATDILLGGAFPVEMTREELAQDMTKEIKLVQESTDSSQWKEYANSKLGFAVKYPQDWKTPFVQGAASGAIWTQKVQIRKTQLESEDSYAGFDVLAYATDKISGIMQTPDFPSLKSGVAKEQGTCDDVSEYVFEAGDYPAKEIYISTTDACYEPTLFFSFTKNGYIYNLVPRKKTGLDILEDQKIELLAEMPEFFAAAATLKNMDIMKKKEAVRSVVKSVDKVKSVVKKNVITARKPVSYKRDSLGRKVCKKDHDNPGKSKAGKGKHMDMECCLDPDEYPNPHCHYDQGKYGKYLE